MFRRHLCEIVPNQVEFVLLVCKPSGKTNILYMDMVYACLQNYLGCSRIVFLSLQTGSPANVLPIEFLQFVINGY